MTAKRPTGSADSREFRGCAYQVAAGARSCEALIAARRPGLAYDSDRAAWADLREAADRLVALIAAHAPAPGADDGG
ncbi:hypothetical protein ACN26Z_14815 [Verrucosispora sp. WMMD703]|uniref:hypothetical protein n=1 Tax=Verrucosispora sp. WMMD703 TaxID=3403463 RepID=UPI003B963E32